MNSWSHKDGSRSRAAVPHLQTAHDIFGVPGLDKDLLAALDRNEIEVLYQPQFAAGSRRLTGGEALARWEHPELGLIGAGALFAIADRSGLVSRLSHHIAHAALGPAAAWPQHLRLSLNITAADLHADDFSDSVLDALAMAQFAPARLTIEITEQALVTGLYKVARKLQALVDRGVRIALDDFGAGFCNFRYLKHLPLHYIKLDHSMIDGVADDARDLAILRGIVAMAHALELEVIAEGVEDEDQHAIVQQEGCSTWQGYLGAPPMTTEEFAELAAG